MHGWGGGGGGGGEVLWIAMANDGERSILLLYNMSYQVWLEPLKFLDISYGISSRNI